MVQVFTWTFGKSEDILRLCLLMQFTSLLFFSSFLTAKVFENVFEHVEWPLLDLNLQAVLPDAALMITVVSGLNISQSFEIAKSVLLSQKKYLKAWEGWNQGSQGASFPDLMI